MSRPLVVTADDFGLTDGVCAAVLDAHGAGTVTATSVLANAPAFAANAGRLADSGMEVGLHVAYVGEDPPLLEAREVPTLVDARGRLAGDWRALARRLARRAVDPADLAREGRAQLDAVTARGLTVTHVNGHQHVQLWPLVGGVVLDLAVEAGAAVLRVPGGDRAAARTALVAPPARRLRAQVRRAGMATPSAVLGLADAGRMLGRRLERAVGRAVRAADPGPELVLHPGRPDDPARDRYRWGYRWVDEWRALTDGTLAGLLAARGLRPVRPSELEPSMEPDGR